jgi:hypothetical protein
MSNATGTKIMDAAIRKMTAMTHGIANQAIGDKLDYPELHHAITLVGRTADGQKVATPAQLKAAIRTITPVIEAARSDFHGRGWSKHDTPYELVQAAKAAKPTKQKAASKGSKRSRNTSVAAAEAASEAPAPTGVDTNQLDALTQQVAALTALVAKLASK